ncbi:MAG: hypothetical protein E7642_08610 [Ruminococcaceae bacterium]|nr:hypothetical protein [Oscillospiraceae bacterium]
MAKLNYFDSLEHLALLSTRAVFIACGTQKLSAQGEIASIRHSADRILCELESFLFSDFMPPLERASICSGAHGILRIIERCNDIVSYRSNKNFFAEKRNREAELCIRLSELVEENTMRLRHIKRPEELPDLVGFRKLVNDARTAHSNMQKKLNSGIYPRSAQHSLCLLGKLRCELARTFDELVEVMLKNI